MLQPPVPPAYQPLALEWYKDTTPLPDREELPAPAALSNLSCRLADAFDEAFHCDVVLHAELDAQDVQAHRVVLQRNPALGLSDAGGEAGPIALKVPGVSSRVLRGVLRAHYLEVDKISDADEQSCKNAASHAELQVLQSKIPEGERQAVEQAFGPLTALGWASLKEVVANRRFTDCVLQTSEGQQVPAHRAIVAGTTDGHYFSAALRWPGSGQVVTMPEGLSYEAFVMLLRLRYGSDDVEAERILEARHFAQLVDWTAVRERCEACLESLVVGQSSALDAESLLAIVAHAEGSCNGMPAHLKAAALAAAIRQWSKVTEVAGASLPAQRCAELTALNRVQCRDGHVCGSLQEYLHAACDDLTEWERGVAKDAPVSVRRQIEKAWQHWHQLLFEYGHIFSVSDAEKWRAKVRMQREKLHEERQQYRMRHNPLPEGRVRFEASFEWREVPQNAICPAGLEYRFDMQTGRNFARLLL